MNQLETFRSFIETQHLNRTLQREEIARAFFKTNGHYSAEEFAKKISKKNPRIGAITVYRTLKLLAKCGLAKETTFYGKIVKYEHVAKHHDHMICTKCGRITEFKAQDVEQAQIRIARTHNFEIKSHKFELYGLCKSCQS